MKPLDGLVPILPAPRPIESRRLAVQTAPLHSPAFYVTGPKIT